VSERDREFSIKRRPWSTMGCCAIKKNGDVWGSEKDLSFLRCSPVMGCSGQANKFVSSIKVREFIDYISEY